MSETKKEREARRKRARARVQKSGISEKPLTDYSIDRMEEEGLIPTREELKRAKEKADKEKKKKKSGTIKGRTESYNTIIKKI